MKFHSDNKTPNTATKEQNLSRKLPKGKINILDKIHPLNILISGAQGQKNHMLASSTKI